MNVSLPFQDRYNAEWISYSHIGLVRKRRKTNPGVVDCLSQWLQLCAPTVQATLSSEGQPQTWSQLPKIKLGHLPNNVTGRWPTLSVCASCGSGILTLRRNVTLVTSTLLKTVQPSCSVSYRWILDLLELWYEAKCSACMFGPTRSLSLNYYVSA